MNESSENKSRLAKLMEAKPWPKEEWAAFLARRQQEEIEEGERLAKRANLKPGQTMDWPPS